MRRPAQRAAYLVMWLAFLHGCSDPADRTGSAADASSRIALDPDEIPLRWTPVATVQDAENTADDPQTSSLTLYGREIALRTPMADPQGQLDTLDFGKLRLVLPGSTAASMEVWASGEQRRKLLALRDQLIAAAPKQTCSSLGSIFLKVNSSYTGLQYLEEALAILGYTPGAVDGQWDAAATRALQRFQANHDLPPTSTMDAASEAAILAGFVEFEEEPGTHVYIDHTGQLKSASADQIELDMGPGGIETFAVAPDARFLGAAWRDFASATLTGQCITVSTHAKTRQVFHVSFWRGIYFGDRR